MYNQLSLFDYDNQNQKIEDVIKAKHWARICNNENCEYYPKENNICTSLYKCDKRMDCQTINSYIVEKLNGRKNFIYPIGGIYIICKENREEIDEYIKKVSEFLKMK